MPYQQTAPQTAMPTFDQRPQRRRYNTKAVDKKQLNLKRPTKPNKNTRNCARYQSDLWLPLKAVRFEHEVRDNCLSINIYPYYMFQRYTFRLNYHWIKRERLLADWEGVVKCSWWFVDSHCYLELHFSVHYKCIEGMMNSFQKDVFDEISEAIAADTEN